MNILKKILKKLFNHGEPVGARTNVSVREEQLYTRRLVYPTLADGVVVTGAAGAWTLGSAAEIVPASTIASNFIVDNVIIEGCSATDSYEVVLYYGASSVEFARFRAALVTGLTVLTVVPTQSIVIPANSVITAKAASKSGGSDTITISLIYHLKP